MMAPGAMSAKVGNRAGRLLVSVEAVGTGVRVRTRVGVVSGGPRRWYGGRWHGGGSYGGGRCEGGWCGGGRHGDDPHQPHYHSVAGVHVYLGGHSNFVVNRSSPLINLPALLGQYIDRHRAATHISSTVDGRGIEENIRCFGRVRSDFQFVGDCYWCRRRCRRWDGRRYDGACHPGQRRNNHQRDNQTLH